MPKSKAVSKKQEKSPPPAKQAEAAEPAKPGAKAAVRGVTLMPLKNLRPDPMNPNRGTPRGNAMLEDSIATFGLGRSVLADKKLEVISGNKTLEKAVELGFTEAIIVPVNGKQLLVAQRMDIDAEDATGRGLAIADNQVSLANIDFDPIVLEECRKMGVDLEKFFYESELEDLRVRAVIEEGGNTETDAAVNPDGTPADRSGDGIQPTAGAPLFVAHTPQARFKCPCCGQEIRPGFAVDPTTLREGLGGAQV